MTGHLRPLSGGPLAGCLVVGLVVGWLLHPLAVRVTGSAPVVTWLQGAALLFVALVLGVIARATHRSLQVEHERMEPHLAVNRLVLGRACALAGALVAGGYAGYAVSWLGDASEMADERLATALLAAAGGVAVLISSLLLERACRVRSDDPEP